MGTTDGSVLFRGRVDTAVGSAVGASATSNKLEPLGPVSWSSSPTKTSTTLIFKSCAIASADMPKNNIRTRAKKGVRLLTVGGEKFRLQKNIAMLI